MAIGRIISIIGICCFIWCDSTLAQNIAFTSTNSANSIFTPAIVADVNCDGRSAMPGTINDGSGSLVSFPGDQGFSGAAAPGVWPPALFVSGRPDDARFADFNGDGCPDLIVQGYGRFGNGPPALLYFNDGTGRFSPNMNFANLNITGHGEGVVVADFNNDGYLDIFLTYYTYMPCLVECPVNPQVYLFLNDGHGNFREVSHQANLDLAPCPSSGCPPGFTGLAPKGIHPEGVQAVDIDNNGFIDLYVGGYLYLNTGTDAITGIPRFVDCKCGIAATATGELPADEGAKFLDWNNDGKLDLVILNWDCGPLLYQNDGTPTSPHFTTAPNSIQFDPTLSPPCTNVNHPFFSTGAPSFNPVPFQDSFGINAYDLDNDGLEDIVTTGTDSHSTDNCFNPPMNKPCFYPVAVFRNTGVEFESVSPPTSISASEASGLIAFGDIDQDGRIDIMIPTSSDTLPHHFQNTTVNSNTFVSVEMLGPNGERNQYGRVVKIQPQGAQSPCNNITYTRVVDGGSGYRAQNQYPLLVGTPCHVTHKVEALYGLSGGGTQAVSFTMNPGQYAQVFAPSAQNPDGNVVIYDRPAPPVPSKAMDWLQPALGLISD